MASNKLINESSPYLQQHAHNPVNWFPWGDEAISLAKETDKPILVSIGYSACHWCHVMERESFEDATIAEFMNEHFVNIKIDREERPDLDHIYMEAVQVMTGSGGWPLNVFLTPQLEPFYGGTYFPPTKAFNRASWMDVLSGVSNAWTSKRQEINTQAENLVSHLKNATIQADTRGTGEDFFTAENARLLVENILKVADKVDGGFGRAPKFPQSFTIQNLLFAGKFLKNDEASKQAHLSLKKMIRGGIYDQLGGGFSRYSTDGIWLVPHFEKMLYDNAFLLIALCEAYQVSADEEYARTIRHTFQFLQREMRHGEGGYYAALDADSEGEEGKFYVWDKEEVDILLGKNGGIVSEYYGISEGGNWEGKNILTKSRDEKAFSNHKGLPAGDFSTLMVEANAQMMNYRNKRIRPGTDDKILLGWNAHLIVAFCHAYAALGDEIFKEEAVKLFSFCTSKFENGDGGLLHTYKNGEAKIAGNLEDYSTMIGAAIALQEITGETFYLEEATKWVEYVIQHFSSEDGLFYFTHALESNILLRKKELFDGAVPSGNSLMVQHLLYLAVIWDRKEWKERALLNLSSLRQQILNYPTSFGVWAKIFLHVVAGVSEIVVPAGGFNNLLGDVLKIYLPNKVLQSNIGGLNFPLLRGKSNSKTMIHICKNYTCLPPVSRVVDYETYVKNLMIK